MATYLGETFYQKLVDSVKADPRLKKYIDKDAHTPKLWKRLLKETSLTPGDIPQEFRVPHLYANLAEDGLVTEDDVPSQIKKQMDPKILDQLKQNSRKQK